MEAEQEPDRPSPPAADHGAEGDPRKWTGAQVVANTDRLLLGSHVEEFVDNPDPGDQDWDPLEQEEPGPWMKSNQLFRGLLKPPRGSGSPLSKASRLRRSCSNGGRKTEPHHAEMLRPLLGWSCGATGPGRNSGRWIPRRKRDELVLAAALTAAALPSRDVRPRPPASSSPAERGEATPRAEQATAPGEEPEESRDFSAEGIRRALLARWEYRPAGIRYSRWEEMLASFADRMAARVRDEDQGTFSSPAACTRSSAGVHQRQERDLGDTSSEPDQMAASEPAARHSDGAGSDSIQSIFPPSLSEETGEETTAIRSAARPSDGADLVGHDEACVVLMSESEHAQQQQSEFTEVSPAQASLGTNLPLAGFQPAGVA